MDNFKNIVSHNFGGHGEPKPVIEHLNAHGGGGHRGGGGYRGGGGRHWGGGGRRWGGRGYGYPVYGGYYGYPAYWDYPQTETVVLVDDATKAKKEEAKKEAPVASTAKASSAPINWSNVALWAIVIGGIGYVAFGGLKKNPA